MSRIKYTKEALKNMMQIGSVTQSSSFLAKHMTKHIPTDKPLKVLELGAGNGAITKAILQQINGESDLVSYEICESFVVELNKIKDSRLVVKDQNVSELSKLPEQHYDVIVSSLPLTLFDKPFKEELMNNIMKILANGGLFIQYQYSLMDRKLIKRHFKNCSTGFCFMNIPPAFIFYATK